MIEAKELSKTFGTFAAVRNVSFCVQPGEAVGFLGPNGAGKTTSFRMMTGSLSPDSGRVEICGYDLFKQPLQAKQKLGYMPENAPLYPELSGAQYLTFRAELKGVSRNKRQAAVSDAAEQAGATAMLGSQIAHLSKGYRQRMALADALLGNPPVLLLDEPTSGLDPNQVLEIRELIERLKKDRAIILSTHILSEVQACCSRAVVIHQGQIVAQGSLDELKRGGKNQQAQLRVRATQRSLNQALEAANLQLNEPLFTENPASAETELRFQLSQEQLLPQVITACVQADLAVVEAKLLSTALDEAFSQLTQAQGKKSGEQSS